MQHMRGRRAADLADEVFCEVGGKHVRGEAGAHAVRVDGERGEHARGDAHRVVHRVQRAEQQLPDLLVVLVVRRRRALEHRHGACEIALHVPPPT